MEMIVQHTCSSALKQVYQMYTLPMLSRSNTIVNDIDIDHALKQNRMRDNKLDTRIRQFNKNTQQISIMEYPESNQG
jgi:hypothetical protein